MTRIVRYYRISSSFRAVSPDIDAPQECTANPDISKSKLAQVNHSISLALIQIILIAFCLTVSTSSFAGLVPGLSQCISASESEESEKSETSEEGEKKKPAGEKEPDGEELDEEDCD